MKKLRQGATLLELVVALGIFSLLFYLALASLTKIQQSHLLADNLWQTASILRRAQSRAMSGEENNDQPLNFGVLFTADYYQEFATSSDYSHRETDFDWQTDLPSALVFEDFNLPDSCLAAADCLLFSAIEGTPSAAGQISLKNSSSGEKETIFINQLGRVDF